MKPDREPNIRLRVAVVGAAIGFCLTAIALRAVHLQVFRDDWLWRKANAQVERSQSYFGRRGVIYDAKLRELAASIDVASVAAYPADTAAHAPASAQAAARALNMAPGALASKLAADASFVWIKRHAAPKEIKALQELALPGIEFLTEHSRFYPNRTLAAQVIGFSGLDGNGLEGIEFYYDSKLRGKEVQVRVLRDALGRGFDGRSGQLEDFSGNNLVLTIDRTIQYVTEKALREAATEFNADSGMAVVLAPKTGAVLAMAHYPFFNPNAFGVYDRERWRNRAITDPFEPGSIMKVFSAAAALEYGSYTPNSIFFCENGAYRIGRNTVHDTKKHGWLSLQQIVKVSSNIGAVKIGEALGAEALHRTLRDFGFGEKTGIDCPGESAGSLADHRRWTRIDAGAIAFGQGLSATAIQVTAAIGALANDGLLMRPHLVQAVTDRNGRLLERFSPTPVRQVVSVQTARAVRKIMQTVTTEGGTGEKAALDGFPSGGKTGTAQKIDPNGRYSHRRYVSSYVGFAPVDDPAVVILVVLDEPKPLHYGGTVAGPAFKKIAHHALDYLNVSPFFNGSAVLAEKK